MKFLTALILSCSVCACSSPTSDEQQVREIIVAAENAAESRDVSDVLELVGPEYADAQGNSRDSLATFLRAFFALHPRIELMTNVESLEFPVEGLARVRVSVRGLELDRFSVGDSVTLDLELRRQDGEWRVLRADRVRER